ncbi:MAG: 23S rRNA (guanosine(2251)-2'-O)-methyltransferase RlmB [Methylocella sp.]|nr:MAG: 23S rRNA (guanosine(2251)-2'-O)-methyltransferase RlmB [Hyphomicrobiales bacterium]
MTRDKSKRSGARTGASGKHKEAPESSPRQAAPDKIWRSELRPAGAGTNGQNVARAKTPVFRRAASGFAVLYGFHAVREALRGKRRKLLDIYATEAAARRLEGEIAGAGLCHHIVTLEDLARRLGAGAVHQGVMLEALALEPLDLSDIVSRSGIVLVLDQITDPHNAGAILRTAAAFGVDALVMTHRHAPEMAGVVAKAASGGLEHVAIAGVVNLARALEELGEMGYLRLGLDSEAELSLATVSLRRPIALVLGGEGKGLRRLSRENCDFLVRLDMPGAIKSLNVSNACAVALTLLHAALAG